MIVITQEAGPHRTYPMIRTTLDDLSLDSVRSVHEPSLRSRKSPKDLCLNLVDSVTLGLNLAGPPEMAPHAQGRHDPPLR